MSVLDGTMDIYLTDFKFGNDACALRLCDAPGYLRVVTRNHLMAASQGEVIVRHLVLPGHLECCTFPILDWLAEQMPSTPINVMGQYHPEHNAHIFPELRRRPSPVEYRRAVEHALSKGLLLV
jgi:putative pyruvate formate lyase activating enzyme